MPKYFNTTFGPLVWNDDGQIIGGKEWLDVDEPTKQIEKYLETNEMVIVDDPTVDRRTRKSKKS